MVLVRKGYQVMGVAVSLPTFVSVVMRSINILLGGSFGVRYSDS